MDIPSCLLKIYFPFLPHLQNPKLIGLVPIQLKILSLPGSLATSLANEDVIQKSPRWSFEKRGCISHKN